MPNFKIELADDEVLVALKRGEGYEDVHPQLVTEDAVNAHWPEWRTVLPDEMTPVLDGPAAKDEATLQAEFERWFASEMGLTFDQCKERGAWDLNWIRSAWFAGARTAA